LDDVPRAGTVELEVATDQAFRKVVARRAVRTSPDVGGSVKASVRGLRAHEEYFYRFATKTTDSPVGRFRTAAPAGSSEPVRFAFFSCQDYTHGYYNALEHMADQDLDFVVCLGDYIYDEAYHTVAGGTGVRDDTIGRFLPDYELKVAVSLEEYREKYSLYRSDPALRAVHANFPMVVIWDDHEVQDNYAGKAPGGGLDPVLGFSRKRQRTGFKAWRENMPTFADPIYRRLTFGDTVDLIMLDQRRYRADQPCDDAVAPPCEGWDQPRDFLGRRQMGWAKDALASSKATWKVIGNEVMAMPAKVLGGSFYAFDSWQGYPREREELLTHIRDRRIDDVVFVTGDIHTFIAGDVRTAMGEGDPAALEFVGGSISSIGLGESNLDVGGGNVIAGNDQNPNTPQALIDALREINPWVDQADFDHHGYGLVRADASSFDCQLVRMETVKRKTTKTLPAAGFRWTVERGQRSIKGVNGPPAAAPPA
ncbi:MAG TPA: alkaline phosphatase D family protein, partial [Capillimicrobium sp.]